MIMTITETIDCLINYQKNKINYLSTITEAHKELECEKEILNNLNTTKSELNRLHRYDEEISKEMPEDFKDWHQNSKEDWPSVTAMCLKQLREELDWAYEEMAGENL